MSFANVMVALAVGFFGGRYVSVRRFVELSNAYGETETIGKMLRHEMRTGRLTRSRRDTFFLPYRDAGVATRADEISWDVPNVVTPFVGTAPAPGQHHGADINRLQFRDRRELALPKPLRTYRVFITGGSTAFGTGAPSQETTIGSYLQHFLDGQSDGNRRFEVFTLANPAWSTTHERILIENRLSELEPDLVISLSGANDVFWSQQGRDTLWFRTFNEQYVESVLAHATNLVQRPAQPDVVGVAPSPVAATIVAEHVEKNVRLSAHALAMKHAKYCFMLQPTLTVSAKALTDRERGFLRADQGPYYSDAYVAMDSRLRQIADDNFGYVNLSAMFDGQDNSREIFVDSFHFAEAGNELIARAMFDYVRAIHPVSETSVRRN